MNISATQKPMKRSPFTFFILVFAISLFLWLLDPLAAALSLEMPALRGGSQSLGVNVLASGFSPLIAALILVYREEHLGGVKRLLLRMFDLNRIKHKIWYVPMIFLLPAIDALTYGIMLFLGRPLPDPYIPFQLIPLLIVVFFFEALGEECGWMGYAIDPLQNRWGALNASLLVGFVCLVWHIIPAIENGETLAYFAGHSLYFIVWRVLVVWLYNNSGKSLFAAIIFHMMDNISYVLFPNYGSHYDPLIASIIAGMVAVVVTFLWGPQTLARFRFTPRRRSPSGTEIKGQPQ